MEVMEHSSVASYLVFWFLLVGQPFSIVSFYHYLKGMGG